MKKTAMVVALVVAAVSVLGVGHAEAWCGYEYFCDYAGCVYQWICF